MLRGGGSRGITNLTGGDTHDTGGDSLVERAEAFVLEHVAGNEHNALHRGLTRFSLGLLQSRLDCVDGRVRERTHGTRDETEEKMLVRGELLILRLDLLEVLLHIGVGSEVDSLVGTLAEGGEGDTTVECGEAFLADDGVRGVGSVAVTGNVEGIGHGMVLGLKTDLDDFHGSDDGNSLRDTGSETSWGFVRTQEFVGDE